MGTNTCKSNSQLFMSPNSDAATRLGYSHRPWEDDSALFRRFAKDTFRAVDEQLVRARFGTAGRDVAEIREDYRQLDEKERRKKALKLMRKEKLRKLREKEREFEAKHGGKGRRGDEDDQSGAEDEEEEPVEALETVKPSSSKLPEVADERKQPGKEKKEGGGRPQRLSRKKKLLAQRKEQRKEERRTLILNARGKPVSMP